MPPATRTCSVSKRKPSSRPLRAAGSPPKKSRCLTSRADWWMLCSRRFNATVNLRWSDGGQRHGKVNLRIRLIAAVRIVLLYACCSGCITVPVRVPTKTISVSGETGKKLDLGFIKAGATTREEIVQKLGWVDTGVKHDNLFVGRWAESSWGVAWAAGGGYSAAGGWNRAWTTHNLVLDFDEKGVVQQSSLVPDKDVIKTLSERISKDPLRSLDLSVPIKAPVEYIRSGKHFLGTLILSKDDFRFLEDRETGSKVAYDFKTPPEN